ncbi:hypothetical protein BKA82DRAFT_860065 [Pisolithus tinctorius]|nr:hypothetical protein BKA82DRAFT_860065 [Pisolithus tinctorius]
MRGRHFRHGLAGARWDYIRRDLAFCPLSFLTEQPSVDSALPQKPFLFKMAGPDADPNDFFTSCISIATLRACGEPPDIPTPTEDDAPFRCLLYDPYPGAFTDFYGLPSNPRSVFKTGVPWFVRAGPDAWRILREARPVCDHPMQDRWLEIGQFIYEYLDSCGVKWTSIDPVRFAEAGTEDVSGLHVWIGIMPGTLAFEAAKGPAKGCKNILAREGFPDVEVAFRESVVTRTVGPKLLSFNRLVHRDLELRSPFTPMLGIPIAPLKTPCFEGTGAVYLRESRESDRVFLLTVAHVARPPPIHSEHPLSRKRSSRAREKIVILGDSAYTDAIDRMLGTIGDELASIQICNEHIEKFGPVVEGEPSWKTCAREESQDSAEKAQRMIDNVNKIHDEVTKHWSSLSQRVIGDVVHAPPIAVDDGPRHFTQDWALISLYHDRINWDTFQGNKIFVGGNISIVDFIKKMHPHPEGRSNFNYPPDGLLQVTEVVEDDEIHKPQQLDANGEKCLIVVKNGKTTGATLGRLSSMESFVRTYPEYDIKKTSIEIAVYPYSRKDGAFSAPGDSGAAVVDSKGRLVGLIVAGAGKLEDIDITYLTPYWWIEKQMKMVFPDSFLYDAVD